MKLEKEVYISGYDKFKNCYGDSGIMLKLNILNPNSDDLKYIYNYVYHSVTMTLEYQEPILDEEERKYLSGVIRPFRDKVIGIYKRNCRKDECIYIGIKDDIPIMLPCFKKGSMYKNMELNKEYSLKDLDL